MAALTMLPSGRPGRDACERQHQQRLDRLLDFAL